jgi:hypothetical protein
MTTRPKSRRVKTGAERVQARRKRLYAAEVRSAQSGMPDLGNPKLRAQIRNEAALLDQHPENDAIDAWLDAVIDPRDWT